MLELFCDLTPINTTLSVKKVTTYSGFIAWSKNPNLFIVGGVFGMSPCDPLLAIRAKIGSIYSSSQSNTCIAAPCFAYSDATVCLTCLDPLPSFLFPLFSFRTHFSEVKYVICAGKASESSRRV